MVNNLFTDYNGTFEPKYLEILLSYGLKEYYKDIDPVKYEKLEKAEKQMITKFREKGSDAVFDDFIDIVMTGESPDTVGKIIMDLSNNPTKHLPKKIRALSKLPYLRKKLQPFTGKIDPDAVNVFRKAKEDDMITGIYSRSLVDLIKPYLSNTGMGDLFDYIKANELDIDNRFIIGKKDGVGKGKGDFSDYLESIWCDPTETAFIDDRDIEPLTQVGKGIAAPSSKKEFKDKCRERGIETPDNWMEVGEILGLW